MRLNRASNNCLSWPVLGSTKLEWFAFLQSASKAPWFVSKKTANYVKKTMIYVNIIESTLWLSRSEPRGNQSLPKSRRPLRQWKRYTIRLLSDCPRTRSHSETKWSYLVIINMRLSLSECSKMVCQLMLKASLLTISCKTYLSNVNFWQPQRVFRNFGIERRKTSTNCLINSKR